MRDIDAYFPDARWYEYETVSFIIVIHVILINYAYNPSELYILHNLRLYSWNYYYTAVANYKVCLCNHFSSMIISVFSLK